MSKSVRIPAESYLQLKELAAGSGRSISDVLTEAIDAFCHRRFFEECDQAYARLNADPVAWQDEQRERQAWDVTLGDGLTDC